MWHRLNSRLFGDVGSWVRFFLTIILNPRELRKAITFQQSTDDQAVWLTTAQAGFPLTRDEEELINSKDAQMGRPQHDISTRPYLNSSHSYKQSSLPQGSYPPHWSKQP
jgi:hypothetical protein